MLISAIYPLTDLRPFHSGLGARLAKPNWSLPDTREFVRSMGPVRERLLGGGDSYLREGYYCESSRDLRGATGVGGTTRLKGLVGSYKRLYFDGFRLEVDEGERAPVPAGEDGKPTPDEPLTSGSAVTGKLEIGLIYGASAARKAGWTDLGDILGEALSAQIKPHRRSQANVPLAAIGEPFARFLQERTTSKTEVEASAKSPPLVKAGETLIIVHLRKTEKFELPKGAQRVDLPVESRHEIHHFRVRSGGRYVRSWILLDKDPDDVRLGRLLRLYLARLHVEHQSLRAMLRAMGTPGLVGTDKRSRDRLQAHLRGGLRRISDMAKLSNEIAGHEMSAIARYSETMIRPGDEETLIDAIKGLALRPNITRSASEYVRKDTNLYVTIQTGGILNMNNTDNRTTNLNQNWGTQNSVQQAGAGAQQAAHALAGEPSSVAEAMAQLAQLVEQMKGELPEEDAAQAAKSLGHLKTELETPGAAPDKGVVLRSLERIGELADKAGKFVEPIGKVVGLVRKLAGF